MGSGRSRAANSPLVADLHIAEIDPGRKAEVEELTNPTSSTDDWEALLGIAGLDAVMISATPETTHYPMTKAALDAGLHVLLEKPMALSLEEADDLIETAEANDLKFTIGYSQRFNDKQSFVKRSVADGSIGDPTHVLVTRHIGRSLGAKIGNRIKLSPAAMEATHDIDFALWCLEPRRPVRVYSQMAWGVRKDTLGLPDSQVMIVTMDDGVVVTINAGMSLPAGGYPNAATTWIELVGTDGTVLVDDSHRDIVHNTSDKGVQFPLSTMPGEYVESTYAGAHGAGDAPLPRGRRLRPAGHGRAPPGPGGHGGLHGRRPVGRSQRGRGVAPQSRSAGPGPGRLDQAVGHDRRRGASAPQPMSARVSAMTWRVARPASVVGSTTSS